MAKAVFISFDYDDANQVGGLRASIKNPSEGDMSLWARHSIMGEEDNLDFGMEKPDALL